MPISLTELVREFAQAAVATDMVCRESEYASFMDDFDETLHAEDGCIVHRPQRERVQIGSGQVDLTRPNLKPQHGLAAKRLRMAVSSDVALEGVQVQSGTATAPAATDEAEAPAPQKFRFTKGHQGERHHGFDATGSNPFTDPMGEAGDDAAFTLADVEHRVRAVRHYQNAAAERLIVRFGDAVPLAALAGWRVRIAQVGDEGADPPPPHSVLRFSEANVEGLHNGVVTWPHVCAWLRGVDDGTEVEVSLLPPTSTTTPQALADQLQQGLPHMQSRVMVAFKDGLSENAAHLDLEIEFERQPCCEGISKVNDRMNQDLGDALDKVGPAAPSTSPGGGA